MWLIGAGLRVFGILNFIARVERDEYPQNFKFEGVPEVHRDAIGDILCVRLGDLGFWIRFDQSQDWIPP